MANKSEEETSEIDGNGSNRRVKRNTRRKKHFSILQFTTEQDVIDCVEREVAEVLSQHCRSTVQSDRWLPSASF